MNVWQTKQLSPFDLSLQPAVPSTFLFEVSLCLSTSLTHLVEILGDIRGNKDKEMYDNLSNQLQTNASTFN